MAYRVLQYTATIPANTPKSALYSLDLDLDNWDIEAIGVTVLAGPSGLMGFYIANNGVQWIPQPAGEFLVWDDITELWTFTDQPNASGWQVVGYNLDEAYDHAVAVRFHVNIVAQPTPTPPVLTIVTAPSSSAPVLL